ncbi:MAG: Na+/H+ antiporter subunit E [Cyanobacteria bacterium J06598_1]
MIGYRDLLLRLPLWFLLTADLSWANILMGIGVSLLIPKFGPRCYTAPTVLKDWIHILWEILAAIPKAYSEAFEMILHPHNKEEIICEKSKPRRTPGLLFLDIFLITFTPKTIVVKHHEEGWNEVHWVRRKNVKRGKRR